MDFEFIVHIFGVECDIQNYMIISSQLAFSEKLFQVLYSFAGNDKISSLF